MLVRIKQYQKFLNLPAVHSACQVIDAFIRLVPPVILEPVFYGGDTEHKHYGKNRDLLAERINFRHPVQEDDADKIQVGDPVELFEEVLWYKRQDGVLGGPHAVASVPFVRVIFVRYVLRQRDIVVHDPDVLAFLRRLLSTVPGKYPTEERKGSMSRYF